jgi:hypothetical protein
MSQEPDWMQEGISADEYFEEYFSKEEINFSLEKKPQKKKTSLNNKLIIITLVFMFAFCGWLIYENTLQKQSIKGLTAQNESLQEEADKVAPLRESYDRIYEKFEELQKEKNILVLLAQDPRLSTFRLLNNHQKATRNRFQAAFFLPSPPFLCVPWGTEAPTPRRGGVLLYFHIFIL